jgi:HEAT repeat protein
MALGVPGDPDAGSKLLAALSDKDPMTRALAAQNLGRLKMASSMGALAHVLATDKQEEVRQAAAVSLRQINVPDAVDALGKALKDASPNVRVTALSGLAHYKDARSAPLVEAVCKDSSVEVRRTAVFVLGRLEDRASVPILEQLIRNDVDTSVRAEAAQTLGDFHSTGSMDALKPLLKDPAKIVQVSAAHSLMMMGDNSPFEVVKALDNDPDLSVRLVAIDSLGWSKDPAAETELQDLLTRTSQDSRPAIEAAMARAKQLRNQ